jgi:hypothetical protein
MIVFRDQVERVRTQVFLDLRRAAARPGLDHDEATSLLVDLGMLEAALVDLETPEADAWSPVAEGTRAACLAAARLLAGTGEAEALAAALGRLAALPLPAEVELRAPEGFAYYGLHPETYLAAARSFAAETAPAKAVVIGLRGIGASLSAVVAAGLEAAGWQVRSLTLRPRGHPFDRRPALRPELGRWLRARGDAWFLIVDEGPGLSGSSFGGTAALLGELGVPDERIAFFPSHRPDPAAFVSADAKARWPRHPCCHVPFDAALLPAAPWPEGSRELSGGAWRALLYDPGESRPAVLPWQERRKFLSPGPPPVLHKFVGLGRFGARARRRAEALAAAGFAPPVEGLRHGYLAQRFVPGRPLRRGQADPAFLRFAARYLGHLGRHFATGEAACPRSLLPMIEVNVTEALGAAPGSALARHAAALPAAPAVALDGRVLAHEWLRTEDGFLKTDATDHHADHGFPGSADIAWDVAGLGIELGLAEGARAELAEAVAAELGDPPLRHRLPFYAVAYLAFRVGHTHFAAASLGTAPDGRRMRQAFTRYRALLAQALGRP